MSCHLLFSWVSQSASLVILMSSWIAKKRREEPLFGTIGRSGTSTSSLTTMCFSMCIIQGPSELGAADRMEVVESNIRLDRCLISFGWLELYSALQHFIMTKASDHRPLLLYTDNQPGALPPAKPAANRELPPFIEHKEPSQWRWKKSRWVLGDAARGPASSFLHWNMLVTRICLANIADYWCSCTWWRWRRRCRASSHGYRTPFPCSVSRLSFLPSWICASPTF